MAPYSILVPGMSYRENAAIVCPQTGDDYRNGNLRHITDSMIKHWFR